MAVYLITYDLKQPGRNYQPLHDYIKQTFKYCKGLESAWLVDTQKSAEDIRDALTSRVDTNDVLFVARLTGDWASRNYPCATWLKEPGRTW
jgi:hypothetical protein